MTVDDVRRKRSWTTCGISRRSLRREMPSSARLARACDRPRAVGSVTALDRIPLRLVSQAASRRNITFVLKNADVARDDAVA